MILIGQYDSPFVRRVGLALAHYGIAFEHRPWSTFGDRDRLAAINPLMRVPTLVTDEGDVLTDSHVVLAHVDGLVAAERVMMPAGRDDRRRALAVIGFAVGLGDLGVGLFYEMRLHERVSDVLVERRRAQIAAALDRLEAVAAAAGAETPHLFEGRLTHADTSLAAAVRFVGEAHPGTVSAERHGALVRRCAGLEATALFRAVSQPFVPPS